MLKEFRKTLFKVIHLRSIIGYNSLVFALRKTPLIGKLIPDELYGTQFLKVIYWIFHVIKEMFMLFWGKIFGLGMIYLFSLLLKTLYIENGMAEGITGPNLFASFSLSFFIIYALCGVVLNTNYFKCTTEKEYLVFMLRMNARKLNNTLFIYDLGKFVIGYLIAGIIAVFCGAPFWLWLGIPVLAVFIKLFGAGFQALLFKLKHDRNKPMKRNNYITILEILGASILVPLFFTCVINGYYVPLHYMLMICAVLILLGVIGLIILKGYGSNLHKKALRDNIVSEEVQKQKNPDNTKQFKKIKAKGSVNANKKGFEYLNALFVKRHTKMLVFKPVVLTIIILLIMSFIIFSFIFSYYNNFGAENTLHMVFNNLANLLLFRGYEDTLRPFDIDSVYSFLRWLAQYQLLGMIIPISIADVSITATQAFYINCDNSLMTFSFFKQRDKILKLFDIRLKLLIKLNIVPALACGLFVDLFLFYTGGQDYPFHYLVVILIPVLFSVINSITWLALYYLFQPFTTTVTVKGGAYNVARILYFSFGALIFWIPFNSLILAVLLTVFTVIYLIVMRSLVKKFAMKTWRVKV